MLPADGVTLNITSKFKTRINASKKTHVPLAPKHRFYVNK